MLLVTHILLAILSVVLAAVTAYKPDDHHFIRTLLATAATIVTGVLLVVFNPAHIEQACVSGLLYIGSIVAILKIAVRKISDPAGN